MKQDQIEFNKFLGETKKKSNIKECLHGSTEHSNCSGKIIAAHSIQRGKILSAIADDGKIYYLGLSPTEDMSLMAPEFKKEGIKKFSTFSGFCSGHDKSIFQPIEDIAFTATPQQLDIYAYRAAAKELHTNLESKKFCATHLGDKLDEDDFPPHFQATLPAILRGEYSVPDYILSEMLEGQRNHSLRMKYKQFNENTSELSLICDDLIGAIERGLTSNFEHFYHSLDGDYPIACCSAFIPYFDHSGNRIISERDERSLAQNHAKNFSEMVNVFLNIFPENGKTHIIFTFSKGNLAFRKAILELFSLDDSEIKIGLSNIIINYSENTAFSPKYIEDNFSDEQISTIKDIFSENIVNPGSFTVGMINMFVDAPPLSEEHLTSIRHALHQASLPLLALVPDTSQSPPQNVKCAVGTGVLIEIEDRLFLLTAKHVLDSYPAETLWFPPAPGHNLETFGSVSTYYDQTHPNRDAAVVELLEPNLAHRIRASGYWKILTVQNVAGNGSFSQAGTRFLSGYPSELGREVPTGFAQSALILQTQAIEQPPPRSSVSVPCPDTDMFFVFDSTLEDTTTAEITIPPKLQGMSGCGIWVLFPAPKSDIWEPWKNLYLIGTQRSVMPGQWIRGVSWLAIADILHSPTVSLSNTKDIPT